jgi:Rieske 2Fe-2S family protein
MVSQPEFAHAHASVAPAGSVGPADPVSPASPARPTGPAAPAAPIDPAGLAESLRPFGESRMLPRTAYVDPAVFSWEQKHFFDGGWSCVGFSAELADPGDQRAVPVGAGSVLLSRDDDGILRAFANTCRHRGHELLPCGGSAQRPTIV